MPRSRGVKPTEPEVGVPDSGEVVEIPISEVAASVLKTAQELRDKFAGRKQYDLVELANLVAVLAAVQVGDVAIEPAAGE